MTKHQAEKCPRCGSHDIGLRWYNMKFGCVCRECDYEITEDSD